MPTRPFDFYNATGEQISGRLELPVGPIRAWALFAHCFTCGKDNIAAVHVSRRLAQAGIGVLRFDFTGLGRSEGEFADTSFSLNIADIVAAAGAMAAAGMPVLLLVGHSLGGAAVLAAAGSLPDVRAVATIGAPFDVAHVLSQIDPDALARIEADGEGMVTIADRPFRVGRKLIEDLRQQDQGERIAALKRPLLLLHSPTDAVVGIDNVTSIYLAARHPKSFISLEGADHLLTRRGDADFATDIIAAWAGRYLPSPLPAPTGTCDAEAEETGLGKFQLGMRVGAARFIADEPESVGGRGSGPTPFNMLSAALAACTTMTLRLYATRKRLPVTRISTCVRHHRENGAELPDVFSRRIGIEGALDEAQRAEVIRIADRCLVHRVLEAGARFEPAELLHEE